MFYKEISYAHHQGCIYLIKINSNIFKYDYNLKELFSILGYFQM